jgi:phage FluMu gp28-like protein
MAREFIDTCAMWAKAFMPAASEVDECLFRSMKPNGETEDIKAFRITFASGFQILALTSRPRSLRGYQGFVIGDEAAFHDELDEVLKSALALLIWGGKVCIISTHDGDENPFNTLCNDIRAGRKPYKLVRIDFDRALSEGLYKRICLMRGKEWSPEAEAEWRKGIFAQYGDGADEELMCIPSRGKGAYLPLALLELRSDPDIPVVCWEMPDSYVAWPEHLRVVECRDWCGSVLAPLLARCDPNLRHYFGQDFARSGDLTVILPLAVDQRLVRRTPFVLEVRNVPFDQQRQVLWYLVDRLPLFTAGAMDASGNGAHVAELTAQKYGLGRIAQVKMTENWYRENMPRYKAAFEDGTIVIPRDANVISDHRAFKLVRGVGRLPDADTSNDKAKGKKAKRHGDSGIAGVLAYAATCAEVMEYAYEPAQPTGAGPANAHERVREDIEQSDAAQLAATLNRDLVRPLVDLNLGPRLRYPRLRIARPDAEDMAALVGALKELVPLGLRVEASVIRDKFGLPEPAEGAEVLMPQTTAQPAPEQETAPQRAAHAARPGSADAPDPDAPDGRDALDMLADEALADWQPLVQGMVDPPFAGQGLVGARRPAGPGNRRGARGAVGQPAPPAHHLRCEPAHGSCVRRMGARAAHQGPPPLPAVRGHPGPAHQAGPPGVARRGASG